MLRDHRSHATGATQPRGHDGQMKQGEQEVLHARDRVGQTSGATQRCLILESARELGIRDAQVDCPVTPRTEAETTDSGADAGHRRHPWPCAWRVGTGWRVWPRRRVRAPWAGGGPDGGRGGRPETDAHRGIMAL